MNTNLDTFIIDVQDAVAKKHEEVKSLHHIAISALDGERSPYTLAFCIAACVDYVHAKDQLKALYAIFGSRVLGDIREDDIREMATWAGIKREDLN